MENTHEHVRRGAWREVAGLLAAVLGLFLLDAAIFRTRLYYPVIEPNATAGSLEMICYLEANRKLTGGKQAVAFGDSRLALTPRLANQVSASRGYEFASVGVAGSSPAPGTTCFGTSTRPRAAMPSSSCRLTITTTKTGPRIQPTRWRTCTMRSRASA
jgi:hypothetical protein